MHSALVVESVVGPGLRDGKGVGKIQPAEPISFAGADNQMVTQSTERLNRDLGFSRRFQQACDSNPKIPDFNHGRLVWVKREIERRDVHVTLETVRKWYSGEASPRKDKILAIAEVLGVDPSWLEYGTDPGISLRERKARNATADGMVNVITGYIQMDGGSPAFPPENDQRAIDEHIDIIAIIRGRHYNIHVASGHSTGNGEFKFAVPGAYERLFMIGVVRTGPGCIDMIEISHDLLDTLGTDKGSRTEVTMKKVGTNYVTAGETWPRITGFDRPL